MLIVLENVVDTNKWLKEKYKIDLEQEYEDIQDLKNQVFGSLYQDAKKYLSSSTVSNYRRKIVKCGNNRRRMMKNTVVSLGRAIYRKQVAEKNIK